MVDGPDVRRRQLPPRARRTFVKVDIEGSECSAFRGMRALLNASTSIIGALVEFDKSHACCSELIEPPLGAFYLLAARHRLCPFQAPVAKPANLRPTPLARLCGLRGRVKQLNLRWQPCAAADMASVAAHDRALAFDGNGD